VADSRGALWNNRAMSNRYWIVVGVVALLAAGAGAWLARMSRDADGPALESGTFLPAPKVLADFDLVDTHGARATLATLRGHPTLVFFGFTHCPDVCPTTLAKLAQIAKDASMPQLRVLLVSVDPARDKPEQLQQYVHAFDRSFKGVTGEQAQIERLAREFGVAIARVDLGGGDYTVDHSAAVFLLDDEARRVAVFPPPFEIQPMAADLHSVADRLKG